MSNYVISLKKTTSQDPFIVFWRANNAGYTVNIEEAGKYDNPEPGYHDDSINFSKPCALIEAFTETGSYGDYKNKPMLPNTKKVWCAIGRPDIAEEMQ